MNEEFVSIEVHNEFAKRIEAEDERQNKRISKLEDAVGKIGELTVSIKELATNVSNMAKEQSKFGDRLEAIEAKPAQNWEKLVWAIGGAIVVALIEFVLKQLGF